MRIFPNFAVVAINPKTNGLSLIGYAETGDKAKDLQDRATNCGWLSATICDSPEELVDFGKNSK
jgi:hypothetical protein